MSNVKKKLKKGTHEEFVARVEMYRQQDGKALEKAGLRKLPLVTFPKRKTVPFLSAIALKVVRAQGGILDTRYFDASSPNLKTHG